MTGNSPWLRRVISADGATVVNLGPCEYGGMRVLAAAGSVTVDIYDDASGTTGTRVDSRSAAAALDAFTPAGGILMLNGIVANCSADPTDNMIVVFYR